MKKSVLEEMLGRAKHAFTLQDFETAEQLTLEVIKAAPKSAAPRILLGTIYGNQKRYADAESAFNRALEIRQDIPEGYNNLGVIFRIQGKYDEAEQALKKALELSPERSDIYYNLGNIYKEQRRAAEAVEAYEQSLQLNPDFILAYNNLGTLFEKAGDFEQAVTVYDRALARDANHPTILYNKGISLQELNRLDEAESCFRGALNSKPGWTSALNNLGIVLQKKDKLDESAEAFREILRLDPNNFTAQNNLATSFVKQGWQEDALKLYRRALEQNPTYSRAAVNLSHIISKDSDGSNLEELERLVESNGSSAELQFQYALSLQRTGKLREAEERVQKLLETEGDNPEYLKLGGLLASEMGRPDDARKYFNKLMEVRPGNQDYLIDLADIQHRKGKLSEAMSLLRDHIDLFPHEYRARRQLAEYASGSFDYTTALNTLLDIRRDFPDDGPVLAELAKVYQQLGQKNDAIEAALELINLQGSRASSDDLTALSASLELYEQAAGAFGDELGESWSKNLDKLGTLGTEPQEEEEEASFDMEVTDGYEEDLVPILDFGGESFFIEEDEIDEDPFEEEFEDLESGLDDLAPSLMSLVDQQGGGEGALSPYDYTTPPQSKPAPPPQAPEPQSQMPQPQMQQPMQPPQPQMQQPMQPQIQQPMQQQMPPPMAPQPQMAPPPPQPQMPPQPMSPQQPQPQVPQYPPPRPETPYEPPREEVREPTPVETPSDLPTEPEVPEEPAIEESPADAPLETPVEPEAEERDDSLSPLDDISPEDFSSDFDDEDTEMPEIPEEQLLPESETVELDDDLFEEVDEDLFDTDDVDELTPDEDFEELEPLEEIEESEDESGLMPDSEFESDPDVLGERDQESDLDIPEISDIEDIPDLSEEPEVDSNLENFSELEDSDGLEDPAELEDTVIDYGIEEPVVDEPEDEPELPSADSQQPAAEEPADIAGENASPGSATADSDAEDRRVAAEPAVVDPRAQVQLFDYLEGLMGDLPNDKRSEFANSHMSSRLSRLKQGLIGEAPVSETATGKSGAGLQASSPRGNPAPARSGKTSSGSAATPETVKAGNSSEENPMARLMKSLAFARDLSDAVSDEEARQLKEKMRNIRDKLRAIGESIGKQ